MKQLRSLTGNTNFAKTAIQKMDRHSDIHDVGQSHSSDERGAVYQYKRKVLNQSLLIPQASAFYSSEIQGTIPIKFPYWNRKDTLIILDAK